MSEDVEISTRQTVLSLVVEQGPVTAGDIARILELTPAAVRRHTAQLAEEGLITDHGPTGHEPPRRGRPARWFVATDAAHERLHEGSADLASDALAFVRELGGESALMGFLHTRTAALEERFRERVADLDARHADVHERVTVLAEVLSEEGFAATVRETSGGLAVQLCQGHCPVRSVAEDFPQLCEAEAKAFGRILGIHVQRLSTQAAGGHVCTTHIPLNVPTTRSRPVHLSRPHTQTQPEGSR